MSPDCSMVTGWIKAHREEIIRDLFDLVRIPSVSDPLSPVRPFGQPCLDALAFMQALAARHGCTWEDFGRRVGRVGFSDGADKPDSLNGMDAGSKSGRAFCLTFDNRRVITHEKFFREL